MSTTIGGSFTTPPLQSQNPDPTGSSSQGDSGSNEGGALPGGSGATSLYLYTFLATLVLLLTISGTIVLRSMHVRRRQRAAILAAIANGTYVPPDPDDPLNLNPGGRRGGIWRMGLGGGLGVGGVEGLGGLWGGEGEKPRMYEVLLVDERGDDDGYEVDEKGRRSWMGITPLAAQMVSSTPSTSNGKPLITASQLSALRQRDSSAQGTSMLGYWRARRERIRRQQQQQHSQNASSSLPPTVNNLNQPSNENAAATTDNSISLTTSSSKKSTLSPVQISVLISMPSPSNPHHHHHHYHQHPSRPSSSHIPEMHGRTMSDSTLDLVVLAKGTAFSRIGSGGVVKDSEREIPVVEIGVVEVGMCDGGDDQNEREVERDGKTVTS